MDNISVTRIWQDIDFFEIRVSASTANISATTNMYITASDISFLAEALASYLPTDNKEFYWELSEGEKIGKNISFRVLPKDKLGHIFIEIYMLIKKAGFNGKYSCFFCIETELGLLNTFGKQLLAINKPVVGTTVMLLIA